MAKILIIDDDDELRGTLAQTLATAGHCVTTAADGMEGAILCRADPPDLLLVDMVMPHGGLATMRVLRSQFPALRVIAMSGRGVHRLDYARSLGAARALQKPFSAEQLSAAVADALTAKPAGAKAWDRGTGATPHVG